MKILKGNKNLKYQLGRRKKVIKEYSVSKPNYFDIRDYFDFKNYSTYIIIKPRNIGGTYSCWSTIKGAYEETGEYSVWMRTSFEEIKGIIDDYKTNRPVEWKPEWKVKGKNLIDENNEGRIVCKFVALTTVHNLASITGDGCFGLIYDEFLPRTARRVPKAFFKITDFLKTLERKHLLTVILMGNTTSLNSDILHKFELWNDINEIDDKERRLRYRYINKWVNPPTIKGISTSNIWASQSKEIEEYFKGEKFLDGDNGLVLPKARLGPLRYVGQYLVDKVKFSVAFTDDDLMVIDEGLHLGEDYRVWVLTTADGFEKGNYKRPYDIKEKISLITKNLERNNITFTSYEVKDTLFKYLISLYGKIQRRVE